jgi:3-dehydroquinate synthase
MAEVIKYGILRDRELFSMVSGGEKPDIEEIITRCVTHKAHYVEADEHDRHERRKLNLGHTVGHAIELAGGFSHTHGEAVAIGLSIISRAAESIGVAEKGTAAIITETLKANGLPTATDLNPEKLLSAITQDKKRGGDTIDLILPVKIGKCVIRPVQLTELPDLLRLGEG